jgi:hypothetical protein
MMMPLLPSCGYYEDGTGNDNQHESASASVGVGCVREEGDGDDRSARSSARGSPSPSIITDDGSCRQLKLSVPSSPLTNCSFRRRRPTSTSTISIIGRMTIATAAGLITMMTSTSTFHPHAVCCAAASASARPQTREDKKIVDDNSNHNHDFWLHQPININQQHNSNMYNPTKNEHHQRAEQRRRRRKRVLLQQQGQGELFVSQGDSALSLPLCNRTSLELSQLEPFNAVQEPCLLYDIQPQPILSNNTNTNYNNLSVAVGQNNATANNNANANPNDGNGSRHRHLQATSTATAATATVVTLVQVTPTTCRAHRDGAALAVQRMNAHNQGRGISVAVEVNANADNDVNDNAAPAPTITEYFQFRLISMIGGNLHSFRNETRYAETHGQLLEGLLLSSSEGVNVNIKGDFKVDFVIGTCSFTSAIQQEKQLAQQYQRILLAQVGPPSYYNTNNANNNNNNNATNNPYLFGMHLSSLEYTKPALRQLSLPNIDQTQTTTPISIPIQVPIHVVYRNGNDNNDTPDTDTDSHTSDLFLKTTCQAALEEARALGFDTELIKDLSYDAYADHDHDGLRNEFDSHFLEDLADQACPPPFNNMNHSMNHHANHPAIFVCVATSFELDTLLQQWKSSGCRPSLLWATPATWSWAYDPDDSNSGIDTGAAGSNSSTAVQSQSQSRLEPQSQVPFVMGSGQWHDSIRFADARGGGAHDYSYYSNSNGTGNGNGASSEATTTTMAMLEEFESQFGYVATYDAVVSYSIATLFGELLQAHTYAYNGNKNVGTISNTTTTISTSVSNMISNELANHDTYQGLRLSLLNLDYTTLMGPVRFHPQTQQNTGCGGGTAAIQWLPVLSSTQTQTQTQEDANATPTTATPAVAKQEQGKVLLPATSYQYQALLTSPLTQAQATMVIPSPDAQQCDAGEHYKSPPNGNGSTSTSTSAEPLLTSKCEPCPVDTYPYTSTYQPPNDNDVEDNTNDNTGNTSGNTSGEAQQCLACPEGSSTDGQTGRVVCVKHDAQLLSTGITALGYSLMSLIWLLSGCCMVWLVWHKLDPVVIIGQFQFLVIICVGAIVSSSTILPLTLIQTAATNAADADYNVGGEITYGSAWGATIGCRVAPFLYTTGWVLEYSSLSAKTYRLFKLTAASGADQFRRQTIHAKNMYAVILVPLLMDLLIVTVWTIVDPLTYVRIPTGVHYQEEYYYDVNDNNDDDNTIDRMVHVLVQERAGRCQTSKYPIWAWTLPLFLIHVCLIVTTNVLLYKVRDVHTRYQEQKNVGLVSLLVLEVALVGVPILFAVRDKNPTASYIVYLGIIALNDLSILGCIFIPKIKYQIKGLPEGTDVAVSIIAPLQQQLSLSHHRRSSIMSINSSMDGCAGGYGTDTVEAMRRRSSLLTSNYSDTMLMRQRGGSGAGASNANGTNGHNGINHGTNHNTNHTNRNHLSTMNMSNNNATHSDGAYRPSERNERDGLTAVTRSRVGNAPGRRPVRILQTTGQHPGAGAGLPTGRPRAGSRHAGAGGRNHYSNNNHNHNDNLNHHHSEPHTSSSSRDPLVRTRRGAGNSSAADGADVSANNAAAAHALLLTRSLVGRHDKTQTYTRTMSQLNRSRVGLKGSGNSGPASPPKQQDTFGPFTGEVARALRAAAALADNDNVNANILYSNSGEAEHQHNANPANATATAIAETDNNERQDSTAECEPKVTSVSPKQEKAAAAAAASPNSKRSTSEKAAALCQQNEKRRLKMIAKADAEKGDETAQTAPTAAGSMAIMAIAKMKRQMSGSSVSIRSASTDARDSEREAGNTGSSGHRRHRSMVRRGSGDGTGTGSGSMPNNKVGRRGSGDSFFSTGSIGGSGSGSDSGRGCLRRLSLTGGRRSNSMDLSDEDECEPGRYYTYDINGEQLPQTKNPRQSMQRRDSLLKDISFNMIVEELDCLDDKDLKANKNSDSSGDDDAADEDAAADVDVDDVDVDESSKSSDDSSKIARHNFMA